MNGFVYDVTDFQHPGGRDKLVARAGTDCSDDFNKVGHKNADGHMDKMKVGRYYDDQDYAKEEHGDGLMRYLLIGGVAVALGFIGYKIFTAKD